MIKRNQASITSCIIHKVGNKYNSATNVFSEKPITFDEESYNAMLPFLLKPFQSVIESYRFSHHANIALNEINSYTSQLFNNEADFVTISKHIVTHLFEQSNSAQIKTGDVIIAMFDDVEFKDIKTQAVGIFKIENKIDFFQTYREEDSFDVYVQKGISTKKLDKGCLIINYSDDQGRAVLSVDTNNYDANYWLQHFLGVTYADDNNQHTQQFLELCKDFSNEVLKQQEGVQEKNRFLSQTIDFFKAHEVINSEEFSTQLFEEKSAQKELFDSYRKDYETLHDVVIRNQFPVSEIVLKKKKKQLKTEITLDTNIQIKLDIDAPEASTEYIEKGYDEARKMKYYKVYYNEER